MKYNIKYLHEKPKNTSYDDTDKVLSKKTYVESAKMLVYIYKQKIHDILCPLDYVCNILADKNYD